MMRKLLLVIISLGLSACGTVGDDFCEGNGYAKKTPGFKQCTNRYKANYEFYKYCETAKGLVAESAALTQCLADARMLKNQYVQDNSFCAAESDKKFAEFFSRPKEEKQPTLTNTGDLVVGNIVLNEPYNSGEINAVTAPFRNACKAAHGWNDVVNWKGGKREVSQSSINSAMNALHAQSIAITIPEHKTLQTFQAAASKNPHMLEQLIRSGHAHADSHNHQGYTALHVAARRGDFLTVQTLIEKLGANYDLRSNSGETATTLAAVGRHHGIANYINEYKLRKERERIERENARRRAEELKALKEIIHEIKKDDKSSKYHDSKKKIANVQKKETSPAPAEKNNVMSIGFKLLCDKESEKCEG